MQSVESNLTVDAQCRELRRRISLLLVFFVAGLVLSGLTAFPLSYELEALTHLMGVPKEATPETYSDMARWLVYVRNGLRDTYARYPFVAYGTDWLAFAHLILAILFLGVLRDPVRNIWVTHFGLIACALVLPLALICGPLRGIPFYWRLIDCSFGIIGFIPLWFVRKYTLKLEALQGASGD
jgi:hypothetical protein